MSIKHVMRRSILQQSIRRRWESIKYRRQVAVEAYEVATATYREAMKTLDTEEADLQKECTHPYGKATAFLGSHSECSDCGLSETV